MPSMQSTAATLSPSLRQICIDCHGEGAREEPFHPAPTPLRLLCCILWARTEADPTAKMDQMRESLDRHPKSTSFSQHTRHLSANRMQIEKNLNDDWTGEQMQMRQTLTTTTTTNPSPGPYCGEERRISIVEHRTPTMRYSWSRRREGGYTNKTSRKSRRWRFSLEGGYRWPSFFLKGVEG